MNLQGLGYPKIPTDAHGNTLCGYSLFQVDFLCTLNQQRTLLFQRLPVDRKKLPDKITQLCKLGLTFQPQAFIQSSSRYILKETLS